MAEKMYSRMDFRTIRKTEHKTSEWSGGTTTQLAIYPPDSDYGLRNFMWRVSTARVEADESVFTPLPGIHRHLMILDGKIRLIHEGRGEVEMGAFSKEEFEGDWSTKSEGRCTDFNLMTKRGECCGALDAVTSDARCVPLFRSGSSTEAWELFYCIVPKLSVAVENGDTKSYALLEMGDVLLLHSAIPCGKETLLSVSSDADLPVFAAVRASVWLV